jgi:hypothetical protein
MKQGFTFTITDHGCLITFYNKGRLIADKFFKNPDLINDSEFGQLLCKYYTSPIIVYLDTLNQTFFEETIPPTTFLIRYKILRQIAFEHKNSMNAVLKYKKTKEVYQFSIAQLKNDNALWLNYITHLENPLDSIRSAPIEISHLQRKLPNSKPLSILTYFDPTIGLRQCVFLYKQFYLSRLIDIKSPNTEDFVTKETKKLIDYLKREEPGIEEKDINIISIGNLDYYKKLDPRTLSHLLGSNIQQICNLKSEKENPHLLSCIVHSLSKKKPIAAFNFDLAKGKKREDWLYTMINALSLSIIFFSIFYILGSVSSFNNFINDIPKLKREIFHIKKKIQDISDSYKHSYSKEYREKIEKIQQEFDKQAKEIQNPLSPLEIVKRYVSNHWDIQDIEWRIQSPKYIEHSLLDKVVKHRSHPYFVMDISLKFKGPRYHAHDTFNALLQIPELKQFQLESLGIKNGNYVLRVTEREHK